MQLRPEIKQILQETGTSVRQLSIKSSVRRQSIMHFLNGGNIHLDNLGKILNALGRSLSITGKTTKKNSATALLKKRLHISSKAIEKFCKENNVNYLAVFGSVLRDDFGKNSDIDILIRLKKPVSFFEFADIEDGLKNLLKTDHKLDVLTTKSISPLLIDEIRNSCEVLYEKAA